MLPLLSEGALSTLGVCLEDRRTPGFDAFGPFHILFAALATL
jgi:hypothetical protein